jgi:hypothetical protein
MELDDAAAVGDQRNGAGNGLFVDEVFYALRDLREDCLIHTRAIGGLAGRRQESSANGEKKLV